MSERPGDSAQLEDGFVAAMFEGLSEPGKRLFIAMAHFSPESGGAVPAIMATSQLSDQDELVPLLGELVVNRLCCRGRQTQLVDPDTYKLQYLWVDDPEGDRWRMPEPIRRQLFRDVLKREYPEDRPR